MKSDLAWKREWEANVREKARQEQARQEQRERQPRAKKRSYDMSLYAAGSSTLHPGTLPDA